MANKDANKESTKPPTALAITRAKTKFVFSWTIGDKDYGNGQQFYWDLNGKRQNIANKDNGVKSIGKTTTSQEKTVPFSSMTGSISFGVRGNRKKYKKKKKNGKKEEVNPGWSDWKLGIKTEQFHAPPAPTATFTLDSPNKGTISWGIGNDDWRNSKDSSFYIFDHYEAYTAFVRNSSAAGPPSWTKIGKTTTEQQQVTGAQTFLEDTALFVGDYSYTRWFHIKAVGPAGTTWINKPIYHTYALPNQVTNTSGSYEKKTSGHGYMCDVKWDAVESFQHPIETTTVQYAIGVPDTVGTTTPIYALTSDREVVSGKTYYVRTEGQYSPVANPTGDPVAQGWYEQTGNELYTITWSPPNNLSWTNAGTITDTAYGDALRFSVDNDLEGDQLLYARVNAKHDDNVVEGTEAILAGAVATLPEPAGVRVDYSGYQSTHLIRVDAENETGLDASYIAVYFKDEDNPGTVTCIGVIPHGESSGTFAAPVVKGEISIGTEILLADYTTATTTWGTQYTILTDRIKMRGKSIKWEQSVTLPPNVRCTPVNNSTIHVSWDWNWKKANQTELSWADHEDAWQSTDPPQSYIVDNIYGGEWNIKGLDVGTWYVRARLLDSHDDVTTVGLWSSTQTVKLSSAPAIPAVVLSDMVTTVDGEVTVYWGYVSTDGTPQVQANICEAILNPSTGKFTYQEPFAKVDTQQSYLLSIPDRVENAHWAPGETRYIAVKVFSGSNEASASDDTDGWSIPAALKIAEPAVCSIVSTSLKNAPGEYALTSDTELARTYEPTKDTEIDSDKAYYIRSEVEDVEVFTEVETPDVSEISTYYEITWAKTYYTQTQGPDETYTYEEVLNPTPENLSTYYEKLASTGKLLRSLPLDVGIAGSGVNSTTTISIERNGNFHIYRPDDNDIDGFDKETVYIKTNPGDGIFHITADEIDGYLDDRANYTLTAVSKISYDAQGTFTQTAKDSINFTVDWERQAIVPECEVQIDTEYNVAILRPKLPDGATAGEGDVCDIYRLSIDKPQLIYEGATFGDRYVDPYPTIGDYGGYRIVYRTKDGDYTTEGGSNIAWFNTSDDENNDDSLDIFASIINFGRGVVNLPYNLSLSSKWAKDFQQTAYLGGHIQGDWNPAVNRTGSINSVGIVTLDYGTEEDHNIIEAMRELAVYAGVCHVRTPDGSNYSANVNVTEDREEKWVSKIAKYTLDITRVDDQTLDAMPYSVWQESIVEEEEPEENEG